MDCGFSAAQTLRISAAPMLTSLPMRSTILSLALLLATTIRTPAADKAELRERRQRAAVLFHDGIVLVHGESMTGYSADGFHQNPLFFYFTGLQNTQGGILAIDGRSGESWLFLPSQPLFYDTRAPGISPLPEGAQEMKETGVEHLLDWSQLKNFLAAQFKVPTKLYYRADPATIPQLPPDLIGQNLAEAPLWLIGIATKYPSFQLKESGRALYALMAVQDSSELVSVRSAAKTTVPALIAGIHAIHPGLTQRTVEAAVVNACWAAGAHGSSFWPWAMTGPNAVLPRPFASVARYDHLDTLLHSGELLRLDVGCEWEHYQGVGCEWEHYQGDLGRTFPVSGHFADDQRELWNIFLAAYQAGVRSLREGITENQVFAIWQAELLRHRDSANSPLAKRAIELWSDRKNIGFWQLHTMNLDAGNIEGALKAGTTIDFEPIAAIDGQGFYLEDMFLITKDGAELLTPGVPYTAEEIEAAMR
jgi:Xaa-Pro aminopeptidase